MFKQFKVMLRQTTALVIVAREAAYSGVKQVSRKVRVERRGKHIVCLPPLAEHGDTIGRGERTTVTGRFSSHDPEQQSINPYQKRDSFAADYGMGERKLSQYQDEVSGLSAVDYSEVETRIISHYAADEGKEDGYGANLYRDAARYMK